MGKMSPETQGPKLTNFERAFSGGTGGCRRTCNCGKTYYDAVNSGYSWEEGEFEKSDAIALDYAPGDIRFEGREYVDGCDCWHKRAKQIMGFIDAHRYQIAEYLSLEKKRKQRRGGRRSDRKMSAPGYPLGRLFHRPRRERRRADDPHRDRSAMPLDFWRRSPTRSSSSSRAEAGLVVRESLSLPPTSTERQPGSSFPEMALERKRFEIRYSPGDTNLVVDLFHPTDPGTEYSGFSPSLAEAAKLARRHREAMIKR
jgi:hypothetical protein